MNRLTNSNLAMLESTAERLDSLLDRIVFVGGCAAGLLLSDPAAPPIRVTKDVDTIVEVVSIFEYHRLSTKLRNSGFREDQSPNAPLCRWRWKDLILDVMPTKLEVLGFGNPWYEHAYATAVALALPSGRTIRVVTAPVFIATKLAAYQSRGRNDPITSHDMEDIVAVIDGRTELMQEISTAELSLKSHLANKFAALLKDQNFLAALPGHLPGDSASQARLPLLRERMAAIARQTV